MTAIPVYTSLARAPYHRLRRDWYGSPAKTPAAFCLTLSGDLLRYRFQAQQAPLCDLSLGAGDFVEGLWEQDVAELFLMAPDGRYHELNLSPTGAWWSAAFSSYRQREKAVRLPSARTAAHRTEGGGWSAEISLALSDLDLSLGENLAQARLSVTAVFGGGRGEPEYLCFGHQNGGEPDFHAISGFLPVDLDPHDKVSGEATTKHG